MKDDFFETFLFDRFDDAELRLTPKAYRKNGIDRIELLLDFGLTLPGEDEYPGTAMCYIPWADIDENLPLDVTWDNLQ